MKKILSVLLALIAVAALVALCGCDQTQTTGREYQKACDGVQISIYEKTNGGTDWDDLVVTFGFAFKNPSPYMITDIVGNLIIEDCNGTTLSSGEASFSGSFDTNVEKRFTLDWRMSNDSFAEQVCNSELGALKISFKMTEVYFEDYGYFEPKYDSKIIKPIDYDYLKTTYDAANTYLSQGEYDKALELFGKITPYQDSSDRIETAQQKRDEAEKLAITNKYDAALAAVESKNYAEAAKLFSELGEFGNCPEKLAELNANGAVYGLEMLLDGKYSDVLDFYTALGYTDMWYAPDDIYEVYSVAVDAQNGIYTGIVALGVTEFTIPDGVIAIGDNAFGGCQTLRKVTIPGTVSSIGEYAFYGCTALKSVDIPDSVTSIGACAFQDCTALSEVELSEELTVIGGGAFANCVALKEIKLPAKLNVIGAQAFYGCKGLRSLTIPDSVTFIGNEALDDCNRLTELSLPAVDDVTISNLFSYATIPSSLVRVTVTSGTILPDSFFQSCTLSEITLPSELTSIGEEAFESCSVTKLIIPDAVTSIGANAFQYANISELTIPKGVSKIPNGMLVSSTVKTLNLHNGITYIGLYVFRDCKLVINYDGTREQWENISKDSLWNYSIGSHKIVCSDATYTYKSGMGEWS